jgi:hypothetical protein
MSKEYTLTGEEREHIEHLSYAMQFIDKTLVMFVESIMHGRLGLTGEVSYKLDGDKIVVDET